MENVFINLKANLTEFGRLTFTEKRNLKKIAQVYADLPRKFDAHYIVRHKLKGVGKNHKTYEVLLAEFKADASGIHMIPHTTSIITDANDKLMYILKENGHKKIDYINISIDFNRLISCGAYDEKFRSELGLER